MINSDHNNMKVVINKSVNIMMNKLGHFFSLGMIVDANKIPFQYLYPLLVTDYAQLFQEAPKTDWIETGFYRDAVIKNLSAFGTLSQFKNIDINLPCSYYIAKFNTIGLTVFEFNEKLVELDNISKSEITEKVIQEKTITKVNKNEKL